MPILGSNGTLEFKKTKTLSTIIFIRSNTQLSLQETLSGLYSLSEWLKITIFDGIDSFSDDADPWSIFTRLYSQKLFSRLVEDYLYPKIPINPSDFPGFSKDLNKCYEFEDQLKKLGSFYILIIRIWL